MFTAREGYTLLVGDQSGFQLRIIAAYMSYYFDDHRLTQCFNNGEDVHQFFADIYGVPRKIAKNITFGWCAEYAKTDVLTPLGWVHLKDVNVGDTVMGYNPDTDRQEWTTVTGTVNVGEQDIYRFGLERGNRYVHTTANHEWLTMREVGSGTNRPLRYTGKVQQQEIADSNSTHKKVLHSALYNSTVKLDTMPRGKHNVDWVATVLRMSDEQRVAFLQGFFLADGCETVNGSFITQNEGNILDAIQLCWFLEGHVSSMAIKHEPYTDYPTPHRCYNMRLQQIRTSCFVTAKQSYLYKAEAGCIETELGSFVMRDTESKFITITGNCFGAGVSKMTATANRGNSNPISSDVIKGALHALEERMPAMPGIKELFIEHAKENKGIVYDWLGTRYVIPELLDRDKSIRASGERKVCNYLIQGLEASLFRHLQNQAAAVVETYGGRQAFCVHDEVGYEVPSDVAELLVPLINYVMSPAFSDFTPEPCTLEGLRLDCEFGIGNNWLDAKGE